MYAGAEAGANEIYNCFRNLERELEQMKLRKKPYNFLTKQMFLTLVAGPMGTLLPVFDKPRRFSDYTRKLPERGEDGATHVLKRDWKFFDTEVYRKGTRVCVGKRIRFLACFIKEGRVFYE